MTWRFGEFELEPKTAELTGHDGPIRLERLPLDLLIYLIENQDRVVSHDDLIADVWGGRIVSDATIATAIKHVRKAVRDNGKDQAIIRTVHGRGFRFVAALTDVPTVPASASTETLSAEATGNTAEMSPLAVSAQPSIAALPFQYLGSEGPLSGLATALPTELLGSLSRMRWLRVISRGSSFQFDPSSFQSRDVGAKLGARYLISGMIETDGTTVEIEVELQTTDDGRMVWSERFSSDLQDIQRARHDIVSSVVASLELELPNSEAERARRLRPEELDAWAHFHLGLSQIYKFRQSSNYTASDHFKRALALDPEFARAHAGLSFTHWQNAFMQFGEDRDRLIGLAVSSAEAALDIDPSDPFTAFNMGRARWLEGDIDGSEIWLNRALRINPNSAQSHYNKGLIQTLEGKPDAAIQSAKMAETLSPLDPLQYAMLSVQAMSNIMLEDFDAARSLMEQAVQLPGAHFYITLIAACADELRGDRSSAERRVQQARLRRPDVTVGMFLQAFPFRDPDMIKTISSSLSRLGLPD